jgi:hypothetical protein
MTYKVALDIIISYFEWYSDMFRSSIFFRDDMQTCSVYNSDLFVVTLINIWHIKMFLKIFYQNIVKWDLIWKSKYKKSILEIEI